MQIWSVYRWVQADHRVIFDQRLRGRGLDLLYQGERGQFWFWYSRFPNDPMPIFAVGIVLINSGSDLCLNNAEIRLEFISVFNGHSCHGSFCGKWVLKWDKIWSSVRSHLPERKSAMTLIEVQGYNHEAGHNSSSVAGVLGEEEEMLPALV